MEGLKSKIESAWDSKLQLTSRKRPRSTNDENEHVRSARASTTISIPIHGLVSKGEVPVMRIRQARNSRNAPFLRLIFPGAIFSDHRTRTRSLGTRFGHDRNWSLYVKDRMESKASVWKTLDEAQKWILENDYVEAMNRVWTSFIKMGIFKLSRNQKKYISV